MTYIAELRNHAQNVCTLYKKTLRTIEFYYGGSRPTIRYHQVQMRAEFDKNRCVTDPKLARAMYWLGEHQLFQLQNPLPGAKFARSPGLCAGVAFGRVVEPPDWVLDYWHPLEKKMYPNYFRCREMRKCDYLTWRQCGLIY